jgi:hypothetical protein
MIAEKHILLHYWWKQILKLSEIWSRLSICSRCPWKGGSAAIYVRVRMFKNCPYGSCNRKVDLAEKSPFQRGRTAYTPFLRWFNIWPKYALPRRSARVKSYWKQSTYKEGSKVIRSFYPLVPSFLHKSSTPSGWKWRLVLKPNSWTCSFVEVSEHNLKGSLTWGFCMVFYQVVLLSSLHCTMYSDWTVRGCVSLKKQKSQGKAVECTVKSGNFGIGG